MNPTFLDLVELSEAVTGCTDLMRRFQKRITICDMFIGEEGEFVVIFTYLHRTFKLEGAVQYDSVEYSLMEHNRQEDHYDTVRVFWTKQRSDVIDYLEGEWTHSQGE